MPPWSRLAKLEMLRARWMLFIALGTAAVGSFVKLTSELTEGELDKFDKQALATVIELRTPALNGAAVDLTALGSFTVLSLIVALAAGLFVLNKHWGSAVQLLVAGIGGGFISSGLKRVLERERPSEIERLVHVASYSYPSGHSLASATVYLTLAILVARLLPEKNARTLVVVVALLLAVAVGASRAYIGVHYPSDIAAGLLLGAGWALLVGAVFSYLRSRGAVPTDDAPHA